MNKIIPYNPHLKKFARQLRKQMTKAEVVLWQEIRKKELGVQFHRQVPLTNYIVDFYCHEILLAIEVDGITHLHEGALEKDQKKEENLNKYGVLVIRFNDEDILNRKSEVLNYIYDLIIDLKKKYKVE
ncbi:MAG: DUF559 domain-containing protein [Chitinophagaceae bacterium]